MYSTWCSMLSLSVDTQDMVVIAQRNSMVLVVPETIVPRRGSDDKAPVDCSICIWPLSGRLRYPFRADLVTRGS